MPEFYNPKTDFRVPLDYYFRHPKFPFFVEPWTTDRVIVVEDGGTTAIPGVVYNERDGTVHVPGPVVIPDPA